MIIADTNLVAYLLIASEHTRVARAVRARDSQWRLPTLWRSEFLNVLATSVKARVLTFEQAEEVWHVAHIIFGRNEVDTTGVAVLKTAHSRNLSAYDAQFVVAALKLSVPLVTSDRRLLKACPDIAVSPAQFAGE
ncbi:MAG TPA: type II toxin-antitoxin system VapC family toxin [Thermoanaerobaculia bacterium]|nr:type II toxin-antitoxin system VapC family toxin [Thermoanaerobaculia bacterium]